MARSHWTPPGSRFGTFSRSKAFMIACSLGSDKAATAYVASLSQLTKPQLVRAFSRALDEARFLPVPALLRDFASIG
jgi:hypothetical protein